MWPKREVKIGQGYDWTIHFFDPTLNELLTLQKAYQEENWEEIKRLTAASLLIGMQWTKGEPLFPYRP